MLLDTAWRWSVLIIQCCPETGKPSKSQVHYFWFGRGTRLTCLSIVFISTTHSPLHFLILFPVPVWPSLTELGARLPTMAKFLWDIFQLWNSLTTSIKIICCLKHTSLVCQGLRIKQNTGYKDSAVYTWYKDSALWAGGTEMCKDKRTKIPCIQQESPQPHWHVMWISCCTVIQYCARERRSQY